MPVLESRVTHITRGNTGMMRELPRNPLGIGRNLSYAEVVVLAFVRQFPAEHLAHAKILGRHANGSCEQRGAGRAGPVRQGHETP